MYRLMLKEMHNQVFKNLSRELKFRYFYYPWVSILKIGIFITTVTKYSIKKLKLKNAIEISF